jgi:2,3-bisphosphoglycerate-dependent phosphoglycerate mutase
MMEKQLILIRHGQSEWNLKNLFTGWEDVALTAHGEKEAIQAGRTLDAHNLHPDHIFTSQLKRAIKTAWLILDQKEQHATPITSHWRLNERHYGDLQGKNKEQVAKEYGDKQVHIWRRSFDVPPPASSNDRLDKYQKLNNDLTWQPRGESLEMTCERVVPYWENIMAPLVAEKNLVLVSAHGNSLRALIKHLTKMNAKDIIDFEFPTAAPLLCHLKGEKDHRGQYQFQCYNYSFL